MHAPAHRPLLATLAVVRVACFTWQEFTTRTGPHGYVSHERGPDSTRCLSRGVASPLKLGVPDSKGRRLELAPCRRTDPYLNPSWRYFRLVGLSRSTWLITSLSPGGGEKSVETQRTRWERRRAADAAF